MRDDEWPVMEVGRRRVVFVKRERDQDRDRGRGGNRYGIGMGFNANAKSLVKYSVESSGAEKGGGDTSETRRGEARVL